MAAAAAAIRVQPAVIGEIPRGALCVARVLFHRSIFVVRYQEGCRRRGFFRSPSHQLLYE